MSHKLTLSIITLSSLGLIGCGGSSSNKYEPVVEIKSGALQVDVQGLPSGADANISITGPNGYSNTINNDITLKDLTPGAYQLSAVARTVNGKLYRGFASAVDVTVNDNQTAQTNYEFGYAAQVSGSVSAFGSLYVNGTRYNTDSASFTINGNAGSEADISLGDRVLLSGLVNDQGSFVATTVDYEATAVGAIEAINLANETITLFGQVFTLTAESHLEDVLFSELKVGDFVEISAVFNSETGYLISKLEREEADEELQLSGQVTAIDEAAKTLNLGETSFSFANITLEQLPSVGDFVTLEFTLDQETNLITELEIESTEVESGVSVSIDGVIEAIADNSITINQQTISFDDNTEFEGIAKDALTVGTRVIVEATFDGTSYLAEEVELYYTANSEVEGTISAIDLALNTITVNENLYTITDVTIFSDDSEIDDQKLTIESLVVGDYVEIDFYYDDLGTAFVTKLEREDNDEEEQVKDLSGEVSEINLETLSFTVSGIALTLNEFSELENKQGEDVNAASFIEQLSIGDKLELEVIEQQGSYLVLEAEYEESENESFEIEGLVADFVSLTEFKVNGYTIVTNENTEFDGDSATIANGVEVEVEAIQQSDNTLLALNVELEEQDNEVELEGEVTEVGEGYLVIGETKVLFNENTEFENGSVEQLVIGSHVEVEAEFNADNQLVATEISFEEVEPVELQGEISEIVDETHFVVNEQTIEHNEQTQFENGNAAKLAVGIKVEVEAIETETGLVATEIAFEEVQAFSLEGEITAVTETSITINEKQVLFDETTTLDVPEATLAVGQLVEVEGYLLDSGEMFAESIALKEE